MRRKLDEAHRKTGRGLAKALLPLVVGTIVAFSPAGQKGFEAIKEYVNERVVMPEEYNGNTDISTVAGYQDKHFYNNDRK